MIDPRLVPLLDAVVKESDADRGAALGVIGMYQSINDHFAQDREGNAPDILALNFGKIGPAHSVFFSETT